ncbi:MAG: hypothetical protein ACFFD1_08470 [Candidatus Thorarchaeota archaeon]
MEYSDNQSSPSKNPSREEFDEEKIESINIDDEELDYSFDYEESDDQETENIEKIDIEQTFDETLSKEWLSLIHFPDETRIRLTKRGRLFVFQTPTKQAADILQIIGRATWNRYKTNLEMTIPFGTIRNLLDNDKDLFVSSFTVITLGTQKVQLPIQLPIKVINSPLPKLMALMCLTRHVFNTGIFQTDNPDKAKAFLVLFTDIFGVELPKGENKRGIYIKIPLPLVQALNMLYTGKENTDVPELIHAISIYHSDVEIIEFLNTWFTFSRIYRNLKHTEEILFMFRANEITNEIVKMLSRINVLWENGSIQEGTRFIPAYIVKNTEENQKILDLTFINNKPSPKELLEKINRLTVQIKMKDERIAVLENLLGDYSKKLEEGKSSRQQDVYSKYYVYSKFYYEKKTEQLRDKFLELKSVKDQLENELKDLKVTLNSYDEKKSILATEEKQKDIHKFPSIDELEQIVFQKVIDKFESDPDFDKNTFYKIIKDQDIKAQEKDLAYIVSQGEDENENETNLVKSNLTNPDISRQIIDFFSIIMDRAENWLLIGLAIVPLTVEQMEHITELNKLELRQLLTKWEKEGLIERIESEEEPLYQFTNLWKKERLRTLRNRMIGRKIPPEIKAKLREILPL